MTLESLSELMKIWWLIAINIFRGCCHFESLAFDEYFFKTNNRENKIFPINDRFCDLHIKNILNRPLEFSSKIIKSLFFLYMPGDDFPIN
jgi:hypothetical protein